jgi:hypothetical protein
MATVKILRECVVQHQRRIPGELVVMDAYTARRLSDEDPETFEWVDRPVKQFVDVTPAAPVGEDVAKTPARKPTRVRGKVDAVDEVDGVDAEVGDESAG